MHTVRITSVINGIENTVFTIESDEPRVDANIARQLRNQTGLEVRVYDELGLRGIMDAL